jgi:hypothetical protein
MKDDARIPGGADERRIGGALEDGREKANDRLAASLLVEDNRLKRPRAPTRKSVSAKSADWSELVRMIVFPDPLTEKQRGKATSITRERSSKQR